MNSDKNSELGEYFRKEKKWWDGGDVVTLITRPRRFGKTLNLSLLDHFFSNRYDNGEALFNKLSIWNHTPYRKLVNRYPVLFISFASVKGKNYETARQQIVNEIVGLYRNNEIVLSAMTDMDKKFWDMVGYDMNDATIADSIKFLCEMMSKYYNGKVLLFLD